MNIISKSKHWSILGFFSLVMTVVLIVTLISFLYSIVALFVLPTSTEYEGTFPSDPPLFTEKFWTNMTHGVLRHIALLHNHVSARKIIGIVGLAFTTNLIYTVRQKVKKLRDAEISGKAETIARARIKMSDYIKWGFGSIISAIISSASRSEFGIEVASIILTLSVSALILSLNYPDFGLFDAIRKWIRGRSRQ